MLFLSPEQFQKVEISHYCTEHFKSYGEFILLIAQQYLFIYYRI
jgi:hypothetical protein